MNSDSRKKPSIQQIGVITVSDRASRGVYEDRGGPAVLASLRKRLRSEGELWQSHNIIVADEEQPIIQALDTLISTQNCCWVIATGGTGPAKRDITPDVIAQYCDRTLPGFGERMRQMAVDRIPTAMLSRQLAATYESTLVLCLPGNPKAIEECISAVFPAIPHCFELLGHPLLPLQERAFDAGH